MERLARIALILIIIIASLYLLDKVWGALKSISEVILIFGLGLLVAYVLEPLVRWLAELHAPGWMRRALCRIFGETRAARLCNLRVGRTVALAVVYLGLVTILILSAVYLVPLTVEQLTQISARIPGIIASAPDFLASVDRWLAERNIAISLSSLYDEALLRQRAEVLLGQAIQYLVTAARAVASFVTLSLLVLAVSFYTVLDGRKLMAELSGLVPQQYQDELAFASQTVDRVFGGFVRGQVLMAVLYGLVALVAMLIAGMPSALVVAWISGIIMIIPLVGAPIAMLLPGLVALFQQPSAAVWLIIAMTVFQQILLHVIIPRIMAETMGLPTLLIIAATMLGVILMGFWGLVFGVPVVAIFYALAVYWLQRVKKRLDEKAGKT
ncbi:MAG: AI-2E family transporter [Anaerolineae bacterium]